MDVEIKIQSALLGGRLSVFPEAKGLIIFADEVDQYDSKNIFVAEELHKAGYGTLLLNLLTEDEERQTVSVFEAERLTERLIGVTKWCMENEKTKNHKIGYFGTRMGSAAALSAAAYWGTKIFAVVSREGRSDLAMDELDLIEAPVLLTVDGNDREIVDLNRKAFSKIGCVKKLEIVMGSPLVFEEEEAIKKVAELAVRWFDKFLPGEGVKERVTTIRKE